MSASPIPTRVGVVAIGRNEGERMIRCLHSVLPQTPAVVYVDSQSTDDSARRARELGATVVELDPARPFTAARARNEGFARLEETWPDLEYVQFVDGDCELDPAWLETAIAHLDAHPEVGAVAGRRRERFPDASPYNRLADLEWDTPVGRAHTLGGDLVVRVPLFRKIGQYDAGLIAGEDPEMCLRVRRAGAAIERLDCEMTLHDANMKQLSQWWRRTTRSGHAYAELFHMQGERVETHYRRKLRSIAFWGAAVPATALLVAPLTAGASLALGLAAWGVLGARIYRSTRAAGRPPAHARLYALACVASKVAEAQGAARFAWNRFVRGERTRLIEYK